MLASLLVGAQIDIYMYVSYLIRIQDIIIH